MHFTWFTQCTKKLFIETLSVINMVTKILESWSFTHVAIYSVMVALYVN